MNLWTICFPPSSNHSILFSMSTIFTVLPLFCPPSAHNRNPSVWSVFPFLIVFRFVWLGYSNERKKPLTVCWYRKWKPFHLKNLMVLLVSTRRRELRYTDKHMLTFIISRSTGFYSQFCFWNIILSFKEIIIFFSVLTEKQAFKPSSHHNVSCIFQLLFVSV